MKTAVTIWPAKFSVSCCRTHRIFVSKDSHMNVLNAMSSDHTGLLFYTDRELAINCNIRTQILRSTVFRTVTPCSLVDLFENILWKFVFESDKPEPGVYVACTTEKYIPTVFWL